MPASDRPVEIQHFILTRFSYRDPSSFSPDESRPSGAGEWGRGNDPLDPQRLALRFTVFEVACLPSVLAQTNQDFDWVVIVDRDLPDGDRERLRELLAGRPRTHIHPFAPGEDLRRLGWLSPYRAKSSAYCLTTNLDDDDAIPGTFVEAIQTHIRRLGAGAPPLKTFGCTRICQWDLITSPRHPLGCVSPWHRSAFVQSVGFSLLCRHSTGDVSVLALSHVLADIWFEKSRGAALQELLRRRWRIGTVKAGYWSEKCSQQLDAFRSFAGPQIAAEVEAFERRPGAGLFHDLSGDSPEPVVVTNHVWNDQTTRLFEKKPLVTSVASSESLANPAMDLELLRRKSTLFKKTWRVFSSHLRESLEDSPRISMARRIGFSIRKLFHLTLWFLRY